MSTGKCLESLSRLILAGVILVGRLGAPKLGTRKVCSACAETFISFSSQTLSAPQIYVSLSLYMYICIWFMLYTVL